MRIIYRILNSGYNNSHNPKDESKIKGIKSN